MVPTPLNKKVVGCKCVYKVKYLVNGSLGKCKVCLVIKGYTQREGMDYHNTFSPIITMATVHTILALTTIKHRDIQKLDVNNAFLHSDIQYEVYMDLPKGNPLYESGYIRLLNKSIYGLKQASRLWFASVLLELGFT